MVFAKMEHIFEDIIILHSTCQREVQTDLLSSPTDGEIGMIQLVWHCLCLNHLDSINEIDILIYS